MKKSAILKKKYLEKLRKFYQTYFIIIGKIEFHSNLELYRKGQDKIYFHTIKQFTSLLGNISNILGLGAIGSS